MAEYDVIVSEKELETYSSDLGDIVLSTSEVEKTAAPGETVPSGDAEIVRKNPVLVRNTP
jgi:hypothetical protein